MRPSFAARSVARHAIALSVSLVAVASTARANVVGSDTQNFNPTTSGLDFVTVQSAETLDPGILNFGLFANHAVNSLPHFPAPQGEQEERLKYSDAVTGLDFNLGVGLLPGVDAGISAPYVVRQEVHTDAFHGEFASRGGTETRGNLKVRLWRTDRYGLALVGSANFNRIRNNPYLGQGAGPTVNGEIAADYRALGVTYGINAGYRARNPGKPDPDIPIRPFTNQLIGSVAASYLMQKVDTKFIVEAFGSRPTARNLTQEERRQQTTAEAIAGLKFDYTTEIAFHVGGGTELNHAFASPDWRAYAGVNWTIGPVFHRDEKPEIVLAPAAMPDVQPKTPKSPPAPAVILIARNIHFRTGEDTMEDPAVIDEFASALTSLAKDPRLEHIEIEGHTDSVGRADKNMDLSKRRAETVRQAVLKRFGLPAEKVTAIGYGQTQPVADNGNYQGRRLNRRVVIKIFRK